jgi:hypothetical protein
MYADELERRWNIFEFLFLESEMIEPSLHSFHEF